MTRAHKIEAWIAVVVAILLSASILGLVYWQRQKPISLWGAVLVQDADPRKELPIDGVTVSAGDKALSEATSNSSGLFILKLRKPIRRGEPIVLTFQHPHYQTLELKDFVANKIYIAHLIPLPANSASKTQPDIKVANVRVRYTMRTMSEANVGSAVKTFQVPNKGNVPCKGQIPCSPDGKWKAAMISSTLDAGDGNEFRDARASCIAGPCPFTKIENDHLAPGGRTFTVTALNWSDTATFVLEADVFRRMVSQNDHWSYPIVFAEGLSFTLPADAQSVSVEADLDGQTIIFPMAPSLFLTWASCDATVNPDRGQVFRCTPKPGYRFQ